MNFLEWLARLWKITQKSKEPVNNSKENKWTDIFDQLKIICDIYCNQIDYNNYNTYDYISTVDNQETIFDLFVLLSQKNRVKLQSTTINKNLTIDNAINIINNLTNVKELINLKNELLNPNNLIKENKFATMPSAINHIVIDSTKNNVANGENNNSIISKNTNIENIANIANEATDAKLVQKKINTSHNQHSIYKHLLICMNHIVKW